MIGLSVLLLLALSSSSALAHADHAAPHKCIHDEIQASTRLRVDPQEYPAEYTPLASTDERKRQLQTVPTQGLRVHFDTFSLGASSLDCTTVGQTTVVSRVQVTAEIIAKRRKKKSFFFSLSLADPFVSSPARSGTFWIRRPRT